MSDRRRYDIDYGQQYQAFLVRLRTARQDAGMTQQEVAESLNKSQAYVSRSENGDRRVDVIELQQFAFLYGKPVLYFLSDID